MKVGTVALIGRPNTGKSTLINNLVGHKVAITSPKPQTTQFPIYAVFDDERGQIVFVDTPGIFARSARYARSGQANLETEQVINEDIDVILYIVDHTRERGDEENKVLGMLRKINLPKILVINKIDIKEPTFRAQYRFMEEEFDEVIEVSALKPQNLGALPDAIYNYLKEGEKIVERDSLATPALNLNSTMHVEELIREKAFLTLRKEVPYSVRVVVDEIKERKSGAVYIKARLLTLPRYKKMIIGAGGARIKQIGSMARRELELSTDKKVFLDLTVEEEK